MLHPDARSRPTAREVLNMPWLKGVISERSQMKSTATAAATVKTGPLDAVNDAQASRDTTKDAPSVPSGAAIAVPRNTVPDEAFVASVKSLRNIRAAQLRQAKAAETSVITSSQSIISGGSDNKTGHTGTNALGAKTVTGGAAGTGGAILVADEKTGAMVIRPRKALESDASWAAEQPGEQSATLHYPDADHTNDDDAGRQQKHLLVSPTMEYADPPNRPAAGLERISLLPAPRDAQVNEGEEAGTFVASSQGSSLDGNPPRNSDEQPDDGIFLEE